MARILYKQRLTPVSPQLTEKAISLLNKVRQSGGKIRKTIRGTTNAVKNRKAKLVYIAGLGVPGEVQVLHLKALCEDYGIPYVCVPADSRYGIAGSAAIIDIGRARTPYYRFIRELNRLVL